MTHRFEGVVFAERRFSDDRRRFMFLHEALRWPEEGVPLLMHTRGFGRGHGAEVGEIEAVGPDAWAARGLREVGWVSTLYRVPGGLIRAEGHVHRPTEVTDTELFGAIRGALVHLGARGTHSPRPGSGQCSVELTATKRFNPRYRQVFSEGMIGAVTLVAQPAFKCTQLRVVRGG